MSSVVYLVITPTTSYLLPDKLQSSHDPQELLLYKLLRSIDNKVVKVTLKHLTLFSPVKWIIWKSQNRHLGTDIGMDIFNLLMHNIPKWSDKIFLKFV